MIKHIGKHNNRKVIILYKKVPGEDHMCLVSYTDSLPGQLHDDIMKILESPIGQAAKELSDVLFRNMASDGRGLLETLHREGRIKKVPTNQVLVTPTTNSQVKLDELNKMLDEMEKGEEAIARLRELDQTQGLIDPRTKKKKPVAESKTTSANISTPSSDSGSGIISDAALALSLKEQALRMAAEAKSLLAESDRLMKEATALLPHEKETVTADVNTKPKAKKTTKVKAN
jgi:hypothetical protein